MLMQHEAHQADLAGMDAKSRGRELERRRAKLGIKSVRAAELQSEKMDRKISRDAITAAEDGTASEGTYQRLEAFYDAYEQETGWDDAPETIVSHEDDYVEFRVSGNFGVDVTVKGPVANMDVLRSAVSEIIREIRADRPDL